MSTVLYIKADPKREDESNTIMLSNEFIEEYKKHNPKDEIITLDLYEEGIKFLDREMVDGMISGELNEVYEYARQFAGVDKYVISAPMWNMSIPAILKAYIDYVVYLDITFKYTDHGAVGLLKDRPRKAIHVVSRGGEYSSGKSADHELGDKYIRTILGFMGIDDVKTLKLELTNVLEAEALDEAILESHEEARRMAREF
ncbi:NAD(P)H-dependent oxidoreductase [Clostridium sp. D2Q-11]|uniref:FMN dependent NADH:quinone oxidoreductase n=1 Tax=Anaeromonas frigoriresistens TaxID=2683708 RepID=A0A942UTZ1_9FIRM|nr:NAD(P)H-dependent oxidoreductase [Anaeromonas frigoriresistens]MBS4538543.1 NAD(P)H-dependent oxidoreductase [Anaeromonas frigoriresistens]